MNETETVNETETINETETNIEVTDADLDQAVHEEVNQVSFPTYCFDEPWILQYQAVKEYESKPQTYLKGCKWSPDGSCLLTCASDNLLRLYDLPAEYYQNKGTNSDSNFPNELSPSLQIKEGELIYDYCWHPHMSSWKLDNCLLASTSKNGPIHFWDAYKGTLAATYRAYNNVDEVEAAYSLCISPDGEKLITGFNSCVRIFNVARPGRDCEIRPLKSNNFSTSQSGIISCLAVNPNLPSIYAAASYMKTIGLYSEPDGTALCVLAGHKGGVTHIKFSPDGLVLYSGGRKDPEILCWDLRNPGKVLCTMRRTVETNQRIYFDLDPSGRYLISGETPGNIKIWDVQTSKEIETDEGSSTVLLEMMNFQVHSDCTNGISCHPWLPLLATTSGQRHVTSASSGIDHFCSDEDDGENDEIFPKTRENSVKLWWTGQSRV